MTKAQAKEIIKNMLQLRGIIKYSVELELNSGYCSPLDIPKHRACNFHDHPRTCSGGVRFCSVEIYRKTEHLQNFGVPGYIEILAGGSSWEEVIEKIEKFK